MHSGRRLAAAFLLLVIGVAAAVGPAPGLLVGHQVSVPSAGSSLPAAPAVPGVPDAPAVPGAPAAPAAPDAGASLPGAPPAVPEPPFVPAPVVGLPVAEVPGVLAQATALLGSALAAKVGGPHDALLLATGSASGFGIAYSPDLGDPGDLGAPLPGTPIEVLDVADRLTSGALDLRRDPQRILLEVGGAAGVKAARANYQKALEADALERAVLAVWEATGIQATADMRAQLHEDAGAVDAKLAQGVALILFAIADAQNAVERALGKLTAEEYRLLWECTKPSDDPFGAACADPLRARAVAETKLDRAALLAAAAGVLSAVQVAEPRLEEFQASALVAASKHNAGSGSGASSGTTSDDADLFVDPTGLIQIGGLGNDIYSGNRLSSLGLGASADSYAQLLTIDFSGQDLYLARAGGTSPGSTGVDSSADPLGLGLAPHQNYQYIWGTLVGVTIDYSGNDYYNNPSGIGFQGAGRLGVGVLLELEGDDQYTASSSAQGAGDAGIGLLYDAQGADTYTASYRSQGFGTFGGVGILLDQGGADQYNGAILTQGAGSNFGAGFLLDVEGNDRYSAITGGTTASQGASHLVGVGVFADGGGYDSYTSSAGARGFIYPAPAPYSLGTALFLDRGMLDTYASTPGANGSTWPQGYVAYGVDRSA